MRPHVSNYLHGIHEHPGEAEGYFFGVLAALHRHFETVPEIDVHNLSECKRTSQECKSEEIGSERFETPSQCRRKQKNQTRIAMSIFYSALPHASVYKDN